MKKKFIEDSFIEIDTSNTATDLKGITNIDDSSLKNYTHTNSELLAEIEKRKVFDFNYRLKYIRINNSDTISLFSFSQDKFIDHKFLENEWQLPLFGAARPYIVNSINPSPGDNVPEQANGYLGIKGFTDEVQMQSLFSGSYMETHRASIPSWTIRDITAVYDLKGNDLVSGRRLEFDLSNGRLIQILYSDICLVEQQIYAHQTLKSLIVHEIQVQFTKHELEFVVLKLPKGRKRDVSGNVHITLQSSEKNYIQIVSGITHVNDQNNHEQHIHAYYHSIPEEIRIFKSKHVIKYYYLMSVNENQETARHDFNEGMTMMENDNELFKKHDSVWENIWKDRGIFMKRSDKVNVELISAQYLLYSNLPNIGVNDAFGALGATGLGVVSNQGAGHSFMTNCGGRIEYSQELWMINSQILIHPQSARAILNKRISQISTAKKNAFFYKFQGAKFPAATNELGDELCSYPTRCQDIHFPSGLVALALSKYLLTTGDRTMFTNETGIGVLMEINEFWKSLLDRYKLKEIESISPNNFNVTVKNSLFDFGLMRESFLSIPTLIAFLEIVPTVDFGTYVLGLHNLSDSVPLPFDKINNFHPPYDGYNLANDKLYLPEGVMLRYPLDRLVDIEAGVRNLQIYEKRLYEPLSPMALSILFINNMDTGRLQEAKRNFETLLYYCENTYKVWSNNSNSWKGSFIPAATAYLDSFMYGLLGIRIRRSGLYMTPKLILDISIIEFSGLEYLGSRIKVIVSASKGISLQIVGITTTAVKLGVLDIKKQKSTVLDSGVVIFPLNTHFVVKRLKLKAKQNPAL